MKDCQGEDNGFYLALPFRARAHRGPAVRMFGLAWIPLTRIVVSASRAQRVVDLLCCGVTWARVKQHQGLQGGVWCREQQDLALDDVQPSPRLSRGSITLLPRLLLVSVQV
ncbi:hypothetical protein O3P69_006006 [Scylla paramamosain]|uniref:Uncharacterized protein n=1 Tax=Scylla paramamosain TaxID=85552 RepID=A0AAW0U7L2_SCYPA